jgi:hypothetical protein
LLYELFYHSTFLGIGEWTIAVWRRWAGVIAIGAITAAVLAGRILHGSLIADSAYTPKISWPQFMKTSLDFTGNLFCHPHSFTPAMVVALWTAMLAIAWLLRSRALGFAWLFLMLSPLPIAFIDPRGIAQYYIPLFGWALYTGVLVNLGFRWALDRFRPAMPVRTRIYASAALVGVLALLLYPVWKSYDPDAPSSVTLEGEGNRSIVRQVHRLEPHLKPGATLMFLDDPVRADWYNLTFLMGLSYRDRRITVYRAKPGASESQEEREIPASAGLAAYDHVFDFRGGYFRELSRPWERIGAMPAVILEYGRAQICHQDWSLVTRDRPAHPGEQVMVKAMDLGETVPRLSPGQTFPQQPLAEVVADIKVLVNGTPAATGTKVGWPGETNLYRLDLRIPENTPRGLSWIDLSTNGVRGPAIEFPVR